MKYKKLTQEQIIISLDRLTRFKKTGDKYLRVFSDIIYSNLLEPSIRKCDIARMEYKEITDIVSGIFNFTLGEPDDLIINKKLEEYENSIFVNDNNVKLLLKNKINYKAALDVLPHEVPVNLQWLKSLADNEDAKMKRYLHLLKFPIENVILAEGITEEILLPAFAKFLGYDFYANGIQVIAAGGKNQVVKMYYKLAEELKVPIFVLLDHDAKDNISQIEPKLRSSDKIHLVSCGEFEDLLPKSLIVKAVNSHFENFLTITEKDLPTTVPTAKVLEELFKTKGLHEFKKAEFAKLVRDNISNQADISEEIADIISEISGLNKTLDTKICS